MFKPASIDAYRLLHEGTLALAEVEANGMRVDVDYLKRTIERTDRKIERKTEKIKRSGVYKLWKRRFKDKTKIGSRDQLAAIVYTKEKDGGLGYEPQAWTSGGKSGVMRPKADVAALEIIDDDGVQLFLEVESLKKTRSTFLGGIWRALQDGFIHTNFNLNLATTYRSSSDTPNVQNFPIRDEILGKLIRRCFIARGKGDRVIVEIDYSQIEVRVAACYNHDPVLIEYIKDKSKDMHRDTAVQIFCCKAEDISKELRHVSKNRFVFPEFYGSYFVQCAPNIWNAVQRQHLTIRNIPVLEWLKQHGIKSLGNLDPKNKVHKSGTFTRHLKKIQDDFWDRRFKVYTDWKTSWLKKYQRECGMTTLTGFRVEGYHKRNDIINYPIQGSAFHCVLWAIIELTKAIKKKKMKSKIISQIHDSIIGDVPVKELDDFVELATRIMTKLIRKHWDWICVPLEVEAEACQPGESWHHKKKLELAA